MQRYFYLPIKVNMATPRARSPRMSPGIARPNAESPYNRKNRIRHQAEIELGIFILFSFGEVDASSASLLLM